jgi:hypothetical protein
MTDTPGPGDAERDVDEIVDAANRLGVELNREEAVQWIVALSAAERESAAVQDARAGVFGNRIALLDFDPQALGFLRRLAAIVRVERPAGVETALAIAGSSAQGRVQLFPGDTDFFERVNIHAADGDAARAVLRELLRATARRAFDQPDVVLTEANFGVYPQAVRERAFGAVEDPAEGRARAAGDPITWTPDDVLRGAITVETLDGRPLTLQWDALPAGQGWNYLGWIVADRESGRIVLASNMLDVTWEDPQGRITSLDGSADPFFQEIYLDPESVPVFTKIVSQLAPEALAGYTRAMRGQVYHYTHEDPNYGKAAKRMYNLFRLTSRLAPAAYVRELFDEPGAQLYQVPGLLEAADRARDPRSGIDRTTVVRQIDTVIRAVILGSERAAAAEIVTALLALRDSLTGWAPGQTDWASTLADVRGRCGTLVNEYFRTRLLGLPEIAAFVATLDQNDE